jgi:hypothetical protein
MQKWFKVCSEGGVSVDFLVKNPTFADILIFGCHFGFLSHKKYFVVDLLGFLIKKGLLKSANLICAAILSLPKRSFSIIYNKKKDHAHIESLRYDFKQVLLVLLEISTNFRV